MKEIDELFNQQPRTFDLSKKNRLDFQLGITNAQPYPNTITSSYISEMKLIKLVKSCYKEQEVVYINSYKAEVTREDIIDKIIKLKPDVTIRNHKIAMKEGIEFIIKTL